MAQNGSFRRIGGKLYLLKPRDYTVTISHDGTVNTTASANLNIDPSSDFILTDRHVLDSTDPTTAAPGLVGQYENGILVQDASNGYNWSNDYVPRSAFARDRAHGYRLPDEVLIAANTRLVVSAKNPGAAASVGTTTVTLQGYSLYPVAE